MLGALIRSQWGGATIHSRTEAGVCGRESSAATCPTRPPSSSQRAFQIPQPSQVFVRSEIWWSMVKLKKLLGFVKGESQSATDLAGGQLTLRKSLEKKRLQKLP
jgi:hypothetical protein